MIRDLALAACAVALGCVMASAPGSAGSGIGLPGFVGSGPSSGIGLPGFPDSGPGLPGMPNAGGAQPPAPAAPSPVKPYFYQPPPPALTGTDRMRLENYQDQLSRQTQDLQRRRTSGPVTPEQQRQLLQAESELDRVNRLLEPCSPAFAGSCAATPPVAPATPLQIPLPNTAAPIIKPR